LLAERQFLLWAQGKMLRAMSRTLAASAILARHPDVTTSKGGDGEG
jgi:hypothetical protein